MRPVSGPPPVPKFPLQSNDMGYHGQMGQMGPYGGMEYEKSDPMGMMKDPYKPYYPSTMPQVFLDECSYTIDKKRMNEIAQKVETYFDEVPETLKNAFTFGKFIGLSKPYLDIDKETERLRDSTYYSNRDRRQNEPQYNLELLNELSTKIKSCDDISIQDLSILIFLVQRTISDIKGVGRADRGYSLSAYELRRRGFQVNPKELLDFLEKMKYR